MGCQVQYALKGKSSERRLTKLEFWNMVQVTSIEGGMPGTACFKRTVQEEKADQILVLEHGPDHATRGRDARYGML